MARWESKRPNEVRDYTVDWTAWLAGDTIATSAVTVNGVTLNSTTNTATSVKVWLSGGADGATATVTNTITTAGGRTETEVFTLQIALVSEPVTLAVAKLHARITDSSEDSAILGYITTAREWVERHTGHILMQRYFMRTYHRFTRSYLELSHQPVIDVTAFSYFDADGVSQNITDYTETTGLYPYRLHPDAIPSRENNSGITVTYLAGYNQGEEPAVLIQAMLILIAGMYDNRGSIPVETQEAAMVMCSHLRDF